MTTNSFTGTITTNDEYQTLASQTGITFSANDVFYIYCDKATIKIENAEIPMIKKELNFTQKSQTIYIKTDGLGSHVVVLKYET